MHNVAVPFALWRHLPCRQRASALLLPYTSSSWSAVVATPAGHDVQTSGSHRDKQPASSNPKPSLMSLLLSAVVMLSRPVVALRLLWPRGCYLSLLNHDDELPSLISLSRDCCSPGDPVPLLFSCSILAISDLQVGRTPRQSRPWSSMSKHHRAIAAGHHCPKSVSQVQFGNVIHNLGN